MADSPGPAAPSRDPRPPDRELVQRLAQGDRAAFGELYDRYGTPAYSLARRICVDPELAEDVVQEAFLAYWRNPAAFDGARGTFGSWFLALVHHKAVDAVRREESHRRRADAAAQFLGQDTVPDVADTVADRITDLRVRSALEGLPAAQREALVLAYWGGMSAREVAAAAKVPFGTARSRMRLGLEKLRADAATAEA